MPQFITETQLRHEFNLVHGGEVRLPVGSKLTPSAAQLLSERKIRIKTIDSQGRVFVSDDDSKEGSGHRVNPLTGSNERPANICSLCHSHVDKKTELMTLLDNTNLVPKTHPRISLRGKLDTLIAQCVVAQTEFDESNFPVLKKSLADLRSYLGHILRCEVTGDELPPISMGEMDADTIHAVSHKPLKYLGHDHLLPEVTHGKRVALLNLLRALAREAELEAARVFENVDFELSRGDILEGLNRLSSAFYILMIMTLMAEKGDTRLTDNSFTGNTSTGNTSTDNTLTAQGADHGSD
ncbi:MAG: ethanolamine utilization cob(I)yrinic acid a,c-diamide adenosyltransferase EutT [Proteobacteria bacterium]|nr:MAG: ethanolamine utilization cob(I)yrinic acid a,c-diamide adenosyltransferase EutT [Pseudomonadota bacterium]